MVKKTEGSVLRAARLGAGYLQTQVAKQLGISQQYLCDIESDRRTMSLRFIKRLPAPLRSAIANQRMREYERAIEELREIA